MTSPEKDDNRDLEMQRPRAFDKEEPPLSSSDTLVRQPSPAYLRPPPAPVPVQKHNQPEELTESQVQNSAKIRREIICIVFAGIVAGGVFIAILVVTALVVSPS
jgi:hypothetical protein